MEKIHWRGEKNIKRANIKCEDCGKLVNMEIVWEGEKPSDNAWYPGICKVGGEEYAKSIQNSD